jgi:hypothetical protein
MFVTYNNSLYCVIRSYQLKIKCIECEIYVLVNCNDTDECFSVPSDECTTASVNCDDNDEFGLTSIIKAMLTKKHVTNPYTYFGYGMYNNDLYDFLKLKIKYNDTYRIIEDILKVVNDGMICVLTNDEIRHFKFNKIQSCFFDSD